MAKELNEGTKCDLYKNQNKTGFINGTSYINTDEDRALNALKGHIDTNLDVNIEHLHLPKNRVDVHNIYHYQYYRF